MAEKVLVAMSGGVDSSVSAALMCAQGYDCTGVTMKLFDGEADARPKSCCALEDVEDARAVAYRLGMDYLVFNFTADFAKQVIDRFVSTYETGGTPNPCIDCNRYLKFEKLYRRARLLGFDFLATGHYARISYDSKRARWLLHKARNAEKDQSYVLYAMTQEQLAHTRFPLGECSSKDEVRALAKQYGFLNAEKQDSQDICFVPDGDYAAFIERYTGKHYPHGAFVDLDGNRLGEHRGIIRYTIGQRKGLGLSLPAPLYVCKKDVAENTVLLGPESALYTTELVADDFNWIAFEPPTAPIRATAQTRYRAKEAAVTARVCADGSVRLTFDTPQRAITSGQAVVLYDGDLVLGGGTIR